MSRTIPPVLRGLHINKDKLVKYLLDPTHPKGGTKAKFLLGFGFTAEHPEELARVLARHFSSSEFAETITDDAGAERVICEGPIRTPDGRQPSIRSVWVVEADTYVRLLTIVPKPRRAEQP